MLDLIVVGGGPAGLAAAIRGHLGGLTVRVYEPKATPIDKACGEGLMPPALVALEQMGVESPAGVPFKGIRYVDGPTTADGEFSTGPGLGVRRIELHRVLSRRALDLGIEVIPETVTHWSQDEHGVEVNGVRARWMVAADGLQSRIRTQLGVQVPARYPARLGVRRHFSMAPWSAFVEVHWSPYAEAYVTPVAADQVGVAILYHRDAPQPGEGDVWDRWIHAFPELKARLEHPLSGFRGAGPFEQRVSSPVVGRILLVGDAAGYLDPLTGEGIRLGFDTAAAAIDCIQRETPDRYADEYRRVTRRYWWLTAGLLFLRRHRFIQRRLVGILRRWPKLFRFALDALNHNGSSATLNS